MNTSSLRFCLFVLVLQCQLCDLNFVLKSDQPTQPLTQMHRHFLTGLFSLCECWIHRYFKSCSKEMSAVQIGIFHNLTSFLRIFEWEDDTVPPLKNAFCFVKAGNYFHLLQPVTFMSVFPSFSAAVAVYTALHMGAFVRQGGMRWLLKWMNLWLRIWRMFMKKNPHVGCLPE